MIHHLSISAQNPQHVAQVLAEILQGQPTPILLIQAAISFVSGNPQDSSSLCGKSGSALDNFQ
jgi:hypothetical protein